MYKLHYTQELSRRYPGLFVILLDQSSSMSMQLPNYPLVGGQAVTKADMVTRLVNLIIQEMVDRAGFEETDPGIRKKYAYLSVLGYSDEVKPLLSKTEVPLDIPTLARNAGTIPEKRVIYDNQGNIVKEISEKKKFWIVPDRGVNTNMKQAFEHAREVVKNWLEQPPELISDDLGPQSPRLECFPPIVINVTDGYYNVGGSPRSVVEDLCRMHTSNGNVLVFNCHFTIENKKECVFPKEIDEIQGVDKSEYMHYAQQMFYMSSIIPEPLIERGHREMRRPIVKGARGAIYNANFEILAQFLRWGTVAMPVTHTAGAY